jgi:beta-hydroxylase
MKIKEYFLFLFLAISGFYLPGRHFVFCLFQVSAIFLHFRGKVRFSLGRALFDYNVLLAPINALMYLFSRIPSDPFIPVKLFPELKIIKDNWQTIRDEALSLNATGAIDVAPGLTDAGFNSFFRTGWTRFHIYWYGVEIPSAQTGCPKTLNILRSIPGLKAAMFASLPPGKNLVRHRDPYAGSIRYHIGLVTPNSAKCYIEVDGISYYWKDGQDVMFDETYIHHAANETDHPRIILFCDIERPLYPPMTILNRWFSDHVMSLAASANKSSETVGGFNRFFSYFYQIRLMFKRIKSYSTRVYYGFKWLTIAFLVYLVFW